MLSRFILFLCLCLLPMPLSAAGPLLEINGELMQGSWSGAESRVAEFRGIPFAAPPVGENRWRAPRPHLARSGVQMAQTFAPACMQGPGAVDWYIRVAAAFGHGPDVVGRPAAVSEDCLYLNAWSPETRSGAKLPVMVFVHGGSNSGGWSYEPNYLGANLAGRGVVVVTVAYRLGPFGFFAHPALATESAEAQANFALLDLRAAFDWIRQHVSTLGGDPQNITAFGESAGALNLLDLMLQDAHAGHGAKSPFRRLVLQSLGGSLAERQDLAQDRQRGEAIAALLGLEGEVTAGRLRAVPAADLLRAVGQLPAGDYHDAVVDGVSLDEQPLRLARAADLSGVEIMLGTNADEWLMYIDPAAGQQELEAWIDEHAPGERAALLRAVADAPDARRALDRLRTARNMVCPSRFLAQQVNQSGGRAWVYYFSRQRSSAGGRALGAYHGAELPYVFDTHDDWLPTAAADRAVTETVLGFWLRFARHGDPTPEQGPHWPVYTPGKKSVMQIDQPPRLVMPHDQPLCAILGPGSGVEPQGTKP